MKFGEISRTLWKLLLLAGNYCNLRETIAIAEKLLFPTKSFCYLSEIVATGDIEIGLGGNCCFRRNQFAIARKLLLPENAKCDLPEIVATRR